MYTPNAQVIRLNKPGNIYIFFFFCLSGNAILAYAMIQQTRLHAQMGLKKRTQTANNQDKEKTNIYLTDCF